MPDVIPDYISIAEPRARYPQENLPDSEGRWRSLVETAPSFIFMMDCEGSVLFSNRLVNGLPPEAVYGRKGWEFVPREYREMVRDAIATVVKTGQPVTIEHPAEGPDRRHAWYSSRLGPVLEDGRVTGVTAVTSDMTEQKRADDRLRESEARLRAMVSAVSDVIIVLDADGTYLEVLTAPELSPLLPAPVEEMIGKRMHDVLEAGAAATFLAVVKETIATQKARIFEFPYSVGGKEYTFESLFAPLRWPDGRDAIVAATQDITARSLMQAELQKLREATEARAAAQYKRGGRYGLSFREMTVLNLIARGQADREIAETLNITRSTVSKHAGSILGKMGVGNRAEASAKAVREGLI